MRGKALRGRSLRNGGSWLLGGEINKIRTHRQWVQGARLTQYPSTRQAYLKYNELPFQRQQPLADSHSVQCFNRSRYHESYPFTTLPKHSVIGRGSSEPRQVRKVACGSRWPQNPHTSSNAISSRFMNSESSAHLTPSGRAGNTSAPAVLGEMEIIASLGVTLRAY
jgi:hypothetical protein